MTRKNDAKFEEKLTMVWKLIWRIWWNLTRVLKNLKDLLFNGLLWPKYIMSELKSYRDLCLMALKIGAKFEGKLTCAFKNGMRNLANFHSLKNSDFIIEKNMAELSQNKFSKQPDRTDALQKLYSILEINE